MKILIGNPLKTRATRWSFGVLAISCSMATETGGEELAPFVVPVLGAVAFSVHDADHDGFISADEFRSSREFRHLRHAPRERPRRGVPRHLSFEQIDKNGDGKITETELLLTLQEHSYNGNVPRPTVP
jgi:hypothetical protein